MNDMKERDFHDFYHESVGLLVWATVGVITISAYMVNRLKKAFKIYEDNNPNIPKFKSLKKKSYALTGYSNKKGKEYGKNVNKLRSLLNFGNEYIEYYDENTLIFSIVYTVDYQETGSSGIDAHSHTIKNNKIYLGEINTKFKKHVDYYMSSASFSLGLYSRELSQFCTEMIDSKKLWKKIMRFIMNQLIILNLKFMNLIPNL